MTNMNKLVHRKVWECGDFLNRGLIFSVTRSLCLAADP